MSHPMLHIYHAPNTRGIRVIWLCEELDIPIEVINIDFSQEYRRTPEWRAISPIGKVPVMVDGDMHMFESGAMVQYVLEKYAKGAMSVAPADPNYGHYLQWFWFAEATLSRPLGEMVNHAREFPGDQGIKAVTDEMADRAETCLQLVADHMQDREYLVGDHFSAADIMMGYAIMLSEMLIPERLPEQLQPYWQSLKSRPAFIAARAK